MKPTQLTEALDELQAFIKNATPAEIAEFIEMLCAKHPELRESLIEALKASES